MDFVYLQQQKGISEFLLQGGEEGNKKKKEKILFTLIVHKGGVAPH